MRPLAAALLLLCRAGLPAAARAQEPFELTQVDAGLYRSRAPRWRSEFEEIRQAGIRTVMDTRAFRPFASRREARLAAEYGLCYRHIRYPALPWALEETEDVFRQMLRTRDYPLLVHCQQNRDRTSVLFGLYRVRVQGWPPEAAYEEMLQFGLRPSLGYFHRYFWENTYGPGMPAARP
jgi:protein tyrosine phosphatase (PTP) superfamily phosphohydrolase (DUF442 family)